MISHQFTSYLSKCICIIPVILVRCNIHAVSPNCFHDKSKCERISWIHFFVQHFEKVRKSNQTSNCIITEGKWPRNSFECLLACIISTTLGHLEESSSNHFLPLFVFHSLNVLSYLFFNRPRYYVNETAFRTFHWMLRINTKQNKSEDDRYFIIVSPRRVGLEWFIIYPGCQNYDGRGHNTCH